MNKSYNHGICINHDQSFWIIGLISQHFFQATSVTTPHQVKSCCTLPVIASSGAGCPEHFEDALRLGEADAALAAGIFHREEVGLQWW